MLEGFSYHPQIIETFPQVVGGILVVRGVQNSASPDPLKAQFMAEQLASLDRLGAKALSEIESLAAWRAAFRRFGVDPTQYRNAAEALLRRLSKKGDIPSINLLVDIGNLVSIRYALPVAMVDTRSIQGILSVCFAQGDENYTELGSEELLHPDAGEVIFVDENRTVFARRWCWRQSAQSAIREDTHDVLVTVEAHHHQSRDAVEKALGDLIELISSYQEGVNLISGILDQYRPRIPRKP